MWNYKYAEEDIFLKYSLQILINETIDKVNTRKHLQVFILNLILTGLSKFTRHVLWHIIQGGGGETCLMAYIGWWW